MLQSRKERAPNMFWDLIEGEEFRNIEISVETWAFLLLTVKKWDFLWKKSDFQKDPVRGWCKFWTLPESFSNSAQMSSRDFDFGIFPTKSLVLGTDTLTLRGFPGWISRLFNWNCQRGQFRVLLGHTTSIFGRSWVSEVKDVTYKNYRGWNPGISHSTRI